MSPVSSTAFKLGSLPTALPQRACHSITMLWDHHRAQDHTGTQEPILQQQSGDIPAHTGMGWGSRCRGEREGFRGCRVGRSDIEGEIMRLQINLYPYSKNIHLRDPGGGPPRRERIWVHSSLTLGYSGDQDLPFYGQILIPLMGENCVLLLM